MFAFEECVDKQSERSNCARIKINVILIRRDPDITITVADKEIAMSNLDNAFNIAIEEGEVIEVELRCPSASPSSDPSSSPSALPSVTPSLLPSSRPSAYPSVSPSRRPSSGPSAIPYHVTSSIPVVVSVVTHHRLQVYYYL